MKFLFVFGTRPEAIKMAPLVKAFQAENSFETKVCVTGQHREMLDQVLEFFDITPDFDLNLMKPNQTLFDITQRALAGLQEVLETYTPDNILVQGDTTTAFVGGLAGYYKKIDVTHIEAGLRSHDLYSPFPEEGNRKLVGHLAKFHFTPTDKATNHLKQENITEHVFQVGNTVIDALFLGLDIIAQRGEEAFFQHFENIDFSKRVILVTGHRRESFGEPFQNICKAIRDIAIAYPDTEIVYPVHLNPNVRSTVFSILEGIENVKLIEPLSYPYLIWLMSKVNWVLTDSGGIQEEAPSLGKPVLVMRDVTERMEGIEAGTAMLVGTDYDKIMTEARRLLEDPEHYNSMAQAVNPYGDGTTSKQVVEVLKSAYSHG
ncbi:MAG: UDP-N-acetylglucosamine 2-epimerase (non-hydrolyzing) [Bacteroidota bacterium]